MIDSGGPSFPGGRPGVEYGMTLRDWLAAQAPVDISLAVGAMGGGCVEWNKDSERAAVFAVEAMLRYEWADAMLAARKQVSS